MIHAEPANRGIWGSRGRRFTSCQSDHTPKHHHTWSAAFLGRRGAALDQHKIVVVALAASPD
jgi:hypothetical protein